MSNLISFQYSILPETLKEKILKQFALTFFFILNKLIVYILCQLNSIFLKGFASKLSTKKNNKKQKNKKKLLFIFDTRDH